MAKGWDTVRLGFLKHLRMRANIPNAKEDLGMYKYTNSQTINKNVGFFFYMFLTLCSCFVFF